MADINQIKRIFEAALFGAGQPLALPQLAALFDEQDMPTHEEIARALEELKNDSEGRGVELVEVASGFRYQVREEVHPFVSRLWTERQTRYSRALLETLALIAYRQPITRAEIEQIRGVGVASSIVKTLEEREWVRVVGYRDLPGKPALFGTTKAFLDYFNLKSLDQLPPLSEIRDIEEIDPQLSLGGPDIPPSPPEESGGDGTDMHGDTPHPGQHAPDPTTDENAHDDETMRDDTPEPAA
jgi:segregation and condensation protein B